MIDWLKQRLAAWAGRVQQREIERLTAESLELKADVMRRNGGRPIRLSPQQHRRLNHLRKGIDPDVLREIDLLAVPE